MTGLTRMQIRALRLKTELLLFGVQPNLLAKRLYAAQNPGNEVRGGYSGGLFFDVLLPQAQLRINAPVWESFAEKSPYALKQGGGKIFLTCRGEKVAECAIPKQPQWYAKKTSSGTKMFRVVQQHSPNQLATAAVLPWCELFEQGEQCRFCLMGRRNKYRPNDFRRRLCDIQETVEAALEYNPRYGIVLNGGTTYEPDRGLRYYIEVVKCIREISDNMPISCEFAPPATDEWLEKLKAAGATHVMMNIEAWCDDARKRWCPGKARLISKARYLSALKRAVDLFGVGNVASCFIVGIEPVSSTIKGIRALMRMGVTPSLLPNVRGNTTARPGLRPGDYLSVLFALEQMDVDPRVAEGACTACGRCSLEGDLYRLRRRGAWLAR